MSRPTDVEVGTELPEQVFRVTRADLVRYAGASGDFNPIHWNERVATDVGLPGVIAHGMFTMALASRVVSMSLPATVRTASMVVVATRRSPARMGRWWVKRCSPCTTRL